MSGQLPADEHEGSWRRRTPRRFRKPAGRRRFCVCVLVGGGAVRLRKAPVIRLDPLRTACRSCSARANCEMNLGSASRKLCTTALVNHEQITKSIPSANTVQSWRMYRNSSQRRKYPCAQHALHIPTTEIAEGVFLAANSFLCAFGRVLQIFARSTR